MSQLTALKFRVQNYRNVDDSGWVPLERVTALVGRNESGKTTILKALHKFNPAHREPFIAQFEFPRYRYVSDFKANPNKPWPVVSVTFAIGPDLRTRLGILLKKAQQPPETVTITRHYPADHTKAPYTTKFSFEPPLTNLDPLVPRLLDALKMVIGDGPDELWSALQARLYGASSWAADEPTIALRDRVVPWAMTMVEELRAIQKTVTSLRDPPGRALVDRILKEATAWGSPIAKALLAPFLAEVTDIHDAIHKPPVSQRLYDTVKNHLPVFIYFENYGILRDEIYLTQFVQDLRNKPNDPETRTQLALFRHFWLRPQEIHDLGLEQAPPAPAPGQKRAAMALDSTRKHERSVRLSSASRDISERFTEWYSQRRHAFRYEADGNYFRVWVSDDRRRDEIELQARSKGLQWFFSFFLVFLGEAVFDHKDAVLLLDEPGLHLHPTAQQELLAFFETLSEKNQLIYTTHSPFLVDKDRLHRVRPVAEDAKGFSRVAGDIWPADRETIFPLQAALGYAILQSLCDGKRNVLVQGLSDLLYLKSLSLHLRAAGREGLGEDVSIMPCGGAKLVGHLASLYLGQGTRPVVVLDANDAGRAGYARLLESLYQHNKDHLLPLGEVLGMPECEMEDLVGEAAVAAGLGELLSRTVVLEEADRRAGTLAAQIEAWAERQGVSLPEGWKGLVAQRVVTRWSTTVPAAFPPDVLDRAERLIHQLNQRLPPRPGSHDEARPQITH